MLKLILVYHNDMKTTEEYLKIRAAVLYILSKFPEGVDYIKLFKTLYFAQKEHIVKYGRPIVSDTFHAHRHGPVPSFTYAAIKAKETNSCTKDFELFLEGITIDKQRVFTKVLPDMDELSQSDVECLDNSFKFTINKDSYMLSAQSHDDAWIAASKHKESDPENDRMTVIEIAKAGNAKPGMIDYIRDVQLNKLSAGCA